MTKSADNIMPAPLIIDIDRAGLLAYKKQADLVATCVVFGVLGACVGLFIALPYADDPSLKVRRSGH